jgi:CDP-glycerol glycerophosphotransferase
MKKPLYFRVVKGVCALLFLPLWHLERLIPRKKSLWIFGAWFGQKYSDNSRALYEYMLENHPEYNSVWITKNKKIFERLELENKPVAMAGSIKGIKTCLQADVAISSMDFTDFNARCLNGIKSIRLWHGMPLKKILFDEDRYLHQDKQAKLTEIFFKFLLPYYFVQYYNIPKKNITITSSDYFIPFLQSAFGLEFEYIFKTGLPRCDKLFFEKKEVFIKKLRNSFYGCKIVLYMPTFRIISFDGKTFNPFSGFNYDEKLFFDVLEKKNIVFLYKPHFWDESTNENIINSNRFFLITDNDFDDLYLLVKDIDILITDYSSIYFDFIVLRKPVILAPFDYDFYIKNARSHYFDYYDGMKGCKADSWTELFDILLNERYYSIDEESIKKYCEYNDGNSSKKCFEMIAGFYKTNK